jgi:ankyrin repeat protein
MLCVYSESSAQTEQAIDILNDLLRDLLGTKEQPTTPDSAAQLEAITSLHDPDAPITSNEAHMSFCDDNASILTTSTSLTTQSKHSLKSILLKTKLYSDPKLFESSGFSISTSRRRGTQWSQFTVGSNTSVFSLPFTDFEGSGLSIAEEGNVSQINVPVDQGLLYRPHWYPSLRPILSPLSTNDTRNQKIRRSSKDSTRPISIPPRPEFEEDSFDLFRTRDMEEVSELILSGRDPDGDLLYHVANKSAVLAELILDRACGQNLKPAVFHPLLNAAISIRYWELIDILFRRNQIPESGLIDPNWRQVTLRYAAESIHIAHALCKGPIPATFLDLAIASDASDDLAPLAFACMRRNVNMVRFLLNNGADALEIPTSGVTALHHATLPPDINITILKMLIDRGADIRSLHHENVPLLHYLITYYFRGPWEPNVHELFRFLLTAGCSSSLTDHNGTTALSHATILKDRRAVELLLDYSSPSLDLEAKDLAGDTALHKALMYHDYLFRELPSLLLRRGASVNATMSDGTTPLLLCLWHSGKQSYTNRKCNEILF